jgi:hypothetical protein
MTARKQDRPLTARLIELGVAVRAAKQRERECEQAQRRFAADVARLTDVIVDAHADGDDARAAKASRERATLEAGGAREAGERLEGARRAAQRAEADRATFLVENVDALIAEREPDARAAAQAVEEAVERLGQAQAAWNAVEADVAALLRLAGKNTGELPQFPEALATLVRDARRAGGVDVPAPLPRTLPDTVASKAAA